MKIRVISHDKEICCRGIADSNLKIWSERIRKTHVAGKCTQYQVAHLDARGRNDVTEAEVMVTQKFRKIVE